jgi:hypothetical protein
MAALQKDYLDWAYRSAQVTVRANEGLKVYAGPEVAAGEFRTLCAEAAREGRDAEVEKLTVAYDRKLEALQDKLDRENRELAEDQSELSQRKMEELGTAAENVFSLFGGRKSSRRISSSLTKRRMTEQAKGDVEESVDAITDFKKQIAMLEKEKAAALEDVNERWSKAANDISEISVAAKKTDVRLEVFGVAWLPYHVIKAGEEGYELPGFGEQ